MSNVNIKNKYTYNNWREVNEPSWVSIVPVKLLEYRYLLKNKKVIINWDMSSEKIKDKYTYKNPREVNLPSSVGIVPVKLLEYRYLFKNKK